MRDAASIADDELLWRCVHPNQMVIRENELRAASVAFVSKPDDAHPNRNISVFIAASANLVNILDRLRGFSVVTIRAGDARDVGFTLEKTPSDIIDEAHADLVPQSSWSPAQINSRGRKLAKAAQVVYVSFDAARLYGAIVS